MKRLTVDEQLVTRVRLFGGFPDFTDPFIRVTEADGECWLWTGALNSKGYGRITADERAPSGRLRQVAAHRVSFERETGATLLQNEVLDHLCRRHACVRPSHLEVVSHLENLLRGDTLAALGAARTHCRNGHPYADDNLRIRPSGARACRACTRERSRINQGNTKTKEAAA